MGLRETLEAATRECAPDDLACVFERDWANEVLADHNHEIVALVLDMGEELTAIRQNGRPDFGDCGAATCEHPGCLYTRKYDALLARLDRIGKETSDE